MRLWFCSASSTDHEPSGLVVAETEEKAIKNFEESLDEYGIWYGSVYIEEITEIDGYKIVLEEIVNE